MSTADLPNFSDCPRCGQALPERKHRTLCPACLMAEALGPIESLDTGLDESSPVSPSQTESLPSSDPLEGTSLGPGDRYKILQRIGEGGFGTVFMAEQTAPVRRRVAIKILKAGMDTRQVVARFEAERQALAMMDHPNIAKILDGGETGLGRPFFVMELVRGTPITTFCDREKLDTRSRLSLFLEVCAAVQHAHQKGIIHRDLKPANILVTVQEGAQPVPKVIDFGVAKAMESNLTDKTLFTRFEQMIGTPAYMSPEQAGSDADASDVDTRADIYALGVLLYELLTGSTPFESATLQHAAFDEVRRILREEEAPRPSARLSSLELNRRTTIAQDRNTESAHLGKQLRGDLDWIVMRAIEKDRRRRYETANALALDLKRHLNNDPVEARPPSTTYRLRKFARRHKPALATAATIFLILVAASIISTVSAVKATEAEKRATKNFTDLETAYADLGFANKTAHQAQQKTQTLLVQTLLEKGTSQFNEGDVTGLITLQEAVSAAEGNESLQNKAMELWTVAHAWLPGTIHKIFDEPYAVAISPDESLVTWCDARHLYFYDTSSADQSRHTVAEPLLKVIPDTPGGDHFEVLAICFSPDGTNIAIHNTETGTAQIWDVVRREPITELLIHPGPPTDKSAFDVGISVVCFSPDGRLLATLSANGSACVWDVERGELVFPPWSFPSRPKGVAFSPSGRYLAIGRNSNGEPDNVAVFDLENSRRPPAMLTTVYRANKLVFLDEDRVWIRGTDHVYLWNFKTGESHETPGSFYESLALSPDRKKVAVGDRGGEALVVSSESSEIIGSVLPHGGGGVRALGFDTSSTKLATGGLDGTVQFWSIGKEQHARIASWPQPGTIQSIGTGSGKSGFLITKSVTVDSQGHQTAAAVLRAFPQSIESITEALPVGATFMDSNRDGTALLLRSGDRKQMEIWPTPNGKAHASSGRNHVCPKITATTEQIQNAVFDPGGSSIVFGTVGDGRHEIRRWNLETHTIEGKSFFSGSALSTVEPALPNNPWLTPVATRSWRIDLVDLVHGEIIHKIRLDNRPASVAVADKIGSYVVASQSGTLRRFRLDSHQELLPSLHSKNMVIAAAFSGDNHWVLTEEIDRNSGRRYWRAWFVGNGADFFSLSIPQEDVDEAHWSDWSYSIVDSLLEARRIVPIGERSFVYQHRGELRRLDFPDVLLRPDQVESAISSALGVRKDEYGIIRSLTSAEFEKAKGSRHGVRQ